MNFILRNLCMYCILHIVIHELYSIYIYALVYPTKRICTNFEASSRTTIPLTDQLSLSCNELLLQNKQTFQTVDIFTSYPHLLGISLNEVCCPFTALLNDIYMDKNIIHGEGRIPVPFLGWA
jgi:hypothetical protein